MVLPILAAAAARTAITAGKGAITTGKIAARAGKSTAEKGGALTKRTSPKKPASTQEMEWSKKLRRSRIDQYEKNEDDQNQNNHDKRIIPHSRIGHLAMKPLAMYMGLPSDFDKKTADKIRQIASRTLIGKTIGTLTKGIGSGPSDLFKRIFLVLGLVVLGPIMIIVLLPLSPLIFVFSMVSVVAMFMKR